MKLRSIVQAALVPMTYRITVYGRRQEHALSKMLQYLSSLFW
ncbi:hypothetical protein EMIT079MI2_70128 [Bacillus sp. IT-79MI2]